MKILVFGIDKENLNLLTISTKGISTRELKSRLEVRLKIGRNGRKSEHIWSLLLVGVNNYQQRLGPTITKKNQNGKILFLLF